jgi:DUF4097 and DUF4098 domain-containing protein YvlB
MLKKRPHIQSDKEVFMKGQSPTARMLIVVAIAGSWMVRANAAEESVKRNFNVAPGGRLTVESDNGSINVRAEAGNQVQIEVRFRKDSWSESRIKRFMDHFKVDFSQNGNDVTVTAKDRDREDGWFSGSRTPEIKFIISVPTRYNLNLSTAGGSIQVGDLEGSVVCETSGGSLNFGRIKGPVDGHTSGGSIQVEGCEGILDVESSGGGISVGSCKGDVHASTSGGSIDISETYGSVRAETSGGSVSATFRRNPLKDCSLETSGGGIEVSGPDDLKVDLDAETSGGRVYTDFPVTLTGEIDPQSLTAKINGGGPRMVLRTSGGNIRVKKVR